MKRILYVLLILQPVLLSVYIYKWVDNYMSFKYEIEPCSTCSYEDFENIYKSDNIMLWLFIGSALISSSLIVCMIIRRKKI